MQQLGSAELAPVIIVGLFAEERNNLLPKAMEKERRDPLKRVSTSGRAYDAFSTSRHWPASNTASPLPLSVFFIRLGFLTTPVIPIRYGFGT